MRKKHAIGSGETKFIYYKTKKIRNKSNTSMEERSLPYSLRQSQNNITQYLFWMYNFLIIIPIKC